MPAIRNIFHQIVCFHIFSFCQLVVLLNGVQVAEMDIAQPDPHV